MSKTLTLTLIQSSLHWEDKSGNLQMFEEKINAIKEKTEIIVLPEMFSTGFSMHPQQLAETMDGETVQWMKNLASKKRVIITGSLIISEAAENNSLKYYNRMLWVLPNGEIGYYDKRHLFAYAGEDKEYTPGNKRLIASVKGWKVLLLVCYDLRYPGWSRQQMKDEQPEYDLIIYVANWPDRRSHAWRTLLQARAIENQCFVAGVNRVGQDAPGNHYIGDSMVADPLGEVLYHKKDEEDIFTITLDKTKVETVREKLPFWKDADGFQVID
jgi:omega-amidase